MIMQNVIDKTSKIVKRYGYCDFENDGSFDSENEEIIEYEFTFYPPIDQQDWYWNGSTFVESL